MLLINITWRLPVPGNASPNWHCRCKRAVCPQSRRTTVAGPCCRRSCSCRSPRHLGVQGDAVSLCVKALNSPSVISQQWHARLAWIPIQGSSIYISLVHRRPPEECLCSQNRRLQREKEAFSCICAEEGLQSDMSTAFQVRSDQI